MKQHHNWGIEEIEAMIPWERDIYVELLKQHLKEEADRLEAEKQKYGR